VSYEFHEVWGGSREECAAKMERFFASTHFAALEPVPLAQRALTELREEFTLGRAAARMRRMRRMRRRRGADPRRAVVVTSRQHALAPATRAWLQRHFPDTFSHVAFGNHYGAGARASKRELCRALGAVALVDDNPRYVAECAEEAGFTGVLFDADYPWARRAEPERAHRNVARVRDWPAAARALRAALRR
jgi:hypothetical protein